MNSTKLFSQLLRNPFKGRKLGYASEVSEIPGLPNPLVLPIGESKSKTWATTVTHVPSWPQHAKPLKSRNWITYLYSISDVILVMLPVYFIVLGVAVLNLNGKPTKDNDFGKKVESAIQLGPTIFPIVFAAISGRSMKMYARYIAEKGANISTLELLMASQSVWGTVESQLLMQRLTLVGVNLLFLWALSPLGGQASLRLMERDDLPSYSSNKLRYLSTGPGATAMGLGSTYEGNGKASDASALYAAALLAPQTTKLGPRDIWGNVKIPSLEAFNSSKADSMGWINVQTNISTPETYSSLVGLPVVNLPSDGSSNFTMEYTYLFVECGKFNQTPYPGSNLDPATTNWTKLDEVAPGQVWAEKSNLSGSNPFTPSGRPTSFFIDVNSPWLASPPGRGNETDYDRLDGFFGHINQTRLAEKKFRTKRELLYASLYATVHALESTEWRLNIARCSLSQKHVEAMIFCDGDQCATQKIRKSVSDTRPESLTGFEHYILSSGFAQYFPAAITSLADGSANTPGSSATERFLSDTSSLPFVQQIGQLAEDVAFVNMSVVSPTVFSKRLSLVLNTYYQLSTQTTGYFGGLSRNLSDYGPDTVTVTDINAYLPANLSATENTFLDWYQTFRNSVEDIKFPFIGATTTANVTTTEEIFACNYAWLALLFASSGLLLITGVVALILKRKTLGPEIFGFVTSMTYDNPYVKIADGTLGGGTTMDAMERAKLLKDVKIYIGDVKGEDDVGHIAMAAGVPLRKLERGRLYS